jgi:transcriptional regulator with XRE-family HTH domain
MQSGNQIARRLAANVRRLRAEAGLSMQALADASGVSRRFLVEVEAARANASLATLGALADALGVDFATLIGGPPLQPVDLTPADAVRVLWTDRQGGRAELLSVAAAGAELWRWNLPSGSAYDADADAVGTELLLTVIQGEIEVAIAAEAVALAAGDSARLVTDVPYRWANRGLTAAVFVACHLPPPGPGRRYAARP